MVLEGEQMVLELQLKMIHVTSVEKLGTLLESFLYSKLKIKNIKNQEVTKRTEGTWYLVKMIAKLLLTMW